MPDMMQKAAFKYLLSLTSNSSLNFGCTKTLGFFRSIKSVVYTSCTVGKVSSVGKDLRGSRFKSGWGHSENCRIHFCRIFSLSIP